MTKIFVALVALVANLGVQYFGHYSSKISDAGTFLGIHYNSAFASAVAFNLKFFWYFIPINIAFAYASKTGADAFGSFLAFMIIWLAAGPVTTLLYALFVSKEQINLVHVLGLFFIFAGAILISANKEILTYLKNIF